MNYRHLRDEATIQATGAVWGELAEAGNLATVAVCAIAPVYEEVLGDRDEEIEYLQGRLRDLQYRMDRIRREAA